MINGTNGEASLHSDSLSPLEDEFIEQEGGKDTVAPPAKQPNVFERLGSFGTLIVASIALIGGMYIQSALASQRITTLEKSDELKNAQLIVLKEQVIKLQVASDFGRSQEQTNLKLEKLIEMMEKRR